MSFTLIIIVITCIVSLIAFSNREIMARFQLNPFMVVHRGEWFRVITHGFLHADYGHLFVNMFVLYMFGSVVENYFNHYFGNKGILYLVILYFGAISASVLTTIQKHKDHTWYNGVGASGAVSAVLFSSVLFQPTSQICLYAVLCLPGVVWAIVYLIYSYYMGKKGTDNTNHDAHLFGALFGIVFTLLIRPSTASEFIDQIMSYI